MQDWILALAASPLVYLGLYLFATIDGFFPPIPSESVVIALAALSSSSGKPNIALIILVAAAGAFTGDQIAYGIGTRINVRRVRFLRGVRGQKTLDWAERALARRGPSFILAARYIPVGRVAVNMTAGAVGYPHRRFVGLTALAAITWAIYSSAIGLGAGAWFKGHPLVAIAVGVVGGLLIGLVLDWVLGRLQNRKERRLSRAEAVAESATAAEPLAADGGPQRAPDPRPHAHVQPRAATGARRERST
ncbi:DedA family protein [Pengzhenrongella frigida]|uniref:DedA family protein n=1 Tax=Pengzhenrongella frigida TaxID=1259133 RepID=A0A4Q5N338_9MICO|nr:DedA family protein [Cellulomonas sp. HLT2-17]RYV51017.1 DedA family protein [Cellulomonas sp. HLT2-17]